jgi:hypothetical protein
VVVFVHAYLLPEQINRAPVAELHEARLGVDDAVPGVPDVPDHAFQYIIGHAVAVGGD